MNWLSKVFGRRGEESLGLIDTIMLTEPPLPMPDVKPPKEKPVTRYPEAERIARSLLDYPEDWAWSSKGYVMKHIPSDFRLWVANGRDGLAERDRSDINHRFEPAEQALVWPHVEGWLSRFRTGFIGRPVSPRIICASTYWYCRAEGQPWVGVGTSPEIAYRSWARAISIQQRKELRPEEILHVWSTQP